MPSFRTAGTALVLTATAASAAVVPAGIAAAATPSAPSAPAPRSVADVLPAEALPTQFVTGALGYAIAPVRDLRIDPLSDTGVDPLDNAVGSQIADFKPLSTAAVTGPITSGGSLGTLPLVGAATGLLPH